MRFLRYMWKDTGTKIFLGVTGVILLFILVWALFQDDWVDDAILTGMLLVSGWSLYIVGSYISYKRYVRINPNQNNIKQDSPSNPYDL